MTRTPSAAARAGTARTSAVRISLRSALVLTIASIGGLAMFVWPLLVTPPADAMASAHRFDAPFLFAAILPVLVAVVLVELADGGLDVKALAMLGVLAALGAVLRPLGAGAGGIETVFFLLVLGGRVFGPGFGFVLGCTTLFASALLTGGIGPWLPFQMLASAWTGLGAGLLPTRVRGRGEIVMLAVYGAVSALAFGFLLNLWFWPFAVGPGTEASFVAGDAVVTNLQRFVTFTIASSTLGWDVGRAITNIVAICVVGPAVLAALRRASRRAAFDAHREFRERAVG